MTPIRFSAADLDLFAAASHDRSPLHTSALYARRSPFGSPLAYGAHEALAVMGRLAPPPVGQRVSAMTLEFSRAVYLDTDYQVLPRPDGAFLMDGSTKLASVKLQFVDGSPWSPALAPLADALPVVAPLLNEADLVPGLERRGVYCPDPDAAAALFRDAGLDVEAWGSFALSVILWASYLVGMQIPGERSLSYRYTIKFDDPPAGLGGGTMTWQARFKARNALNLVKNDVELFVGGQRVASGQIEALLRPPAVVSRFVFPQSEELAGNTALVIGASRGLGAALTRALVARGAHVIAGFSQCLPDAEKLREESHGKIELARGDASELGWCAQLKERYPKLDFLVLNACPSLLGLKPEAESVGRMNAYVSRGFAMVSAPLSVFAGTVENRTVLISAGYVETLPKEYPHVVAAKAAAEGLLQAVARQHRKAGYLIVRPPKMLTDMTNAPYGADDAVAVEPVACRVVDRLCGAFSPGEVEILRG